VKGVIQTALAKVEGVVQGGVIYDEGEVIKRGTYASTAQRAGP
jgi:hypothetical protein